MLKANFYAFFMWQSKVKNPERKIEPRGCIQADTVNVLSTHILSLEVIYTPAFEHVPLPLIMIRIVTETY